MFSAVLVIVYNNIINVFEQFYTVDSAFIHNNIILYCSIDTYKNWHIIHNYENVLIS